MSKTIGIIGASAGVGAQCVRIALERGHRVRSLSRRVDVLPDHPMLRVVQGSATDVHDLRLVIQDADAVVVTLGTGMDRKPATTPSAS